MWISRAHFELIQTRAKEFREWHEREKDLWCERLAERDVTIAQQEKRINALEDERTEVLGKLFAKEESRSKPPETLPEPASNWERIMQEQAEEAEKPDA